MIDPASFKNARLHGGFVITEVRFSREPFEDALGRAAIAQTRTLGKNFQLLIRSGLNERELSVTLYHEILEAATVALSHPAPSVLDFNEGDFERAG